MRASLEMSIGRRTLSLESELITRLETLEDFLESEDLLGSAFLHNGERRTLDEVVAGMGGDLPRYIALGERAGHVSGFWLAGFQTLEEGAGLLKETVETVPGIVLEIFDLDNEVGVPWAIKLG